MRFGERLLALGRAHASEHGSRAHILCAAGRWCVYWGSRGHWLDPWF